MMKVKNWQPKQPKLGAYVTEYWRPIDDLDREPIAVRSKVVGYSAEGLAVLQIVDNSGGFELGKAYVVAGYARTLAYSYMLGEEE